MLAPREPGLLSEGGQGHAAPARAKVTGDRAARRDDGPHQVIAGGDGEQPPAAPTTPIAPATTSSRPRIGAAMPASPTVASSFSTA